MNITDYLVQKSNGLLQIQPEINDWTGKKYRMFNTGSVEVEVAEFLYAMVRLTKPKMILDTGTHYGVSAAYMAQALKDNGLGGMVDSYEINPIYAEEALKLWKTLDILDIRSFVDDFAKSPLIEDKYQFALLDTEPQLRFAELIKVYHHIEQGGFIFIHDLHRHMSQGDNAEHGFGWPFGKLPEEIIAWMKEGRLRPWHFPTPRGLAGFYKTDPGDYKFL